MHIASKAFGHDLTCACCVICIRRPGPKRHGTTLDLPLHCSEGCRPCVSADLRAEASQRLIVRVIARPDAQFDGIEPGKEQFVDGRFKAREIREYADRFAASAGTSTGVRHL